MYIIIAATLSLFIGIKMGAEIRDSAWSSNADDVHGLEHRGRIYKVFYADTDHRQSANESYYE